MFHEVLKYIFNYGFWFPKIIVCTSSHLDVASTLLRAFVACSGLKRICKNVTLDGTVPILFPATIVGKLWRSFI